MIEALATMALELTDQGGLVCLLDDAVSVAGMVDQVAHCEPIVALCLGALWRVANTLAGTWGTVVPNGVSAIE